MIKTTNKKSKKESSDNIQISVNVRMSIEESHDDASDELERAEITTTTTEDHSEVTDNTSEMPTEYHHAHGGGGTTVISDVTTQFLDEQENVVVNNNDDQFYNNDNYNHEVCENNGVDNSHSSHKKNDDDSVVGECSVCFESFNATTSKKLPCGHTYHNDCVLSWLKRNPSCPLCRQDTRNMIQYHVFSAMWQPSVVFGVKIVTCDLNGLLIVTYVDPYGAGEKQGVKVGDYLVKQDGIDIQNGIDDRIFGKKLVELQKPAVFGFVRPTYESHPMETEINNESMILTGATPLNLPTTTTTNLETTTNNTRRRSWFSRKMLLLLEFPSRMRSRQNQRQV